MQQENNEYLSFQEEDLKDFFCPISGELIKDPVLSKYGHTYERRAIESWLEQSKICPITQQPLTKDDLFPNFIIKKLIDSYKQKDQKINQLQQENQQLKQKHQSNQEDIERLSKKIEKYKLSYQQLNPKGNFKGNFKGNLKLSFFSEVKEKDLNYKKRFRTSLEAVDYFSDEIKRQKNFNPKDLEALMRDVMEGNLDEVAERLNKQPELMRCQMKWVDYAGRVFPKITPFQLAVWYGDWHMWNLMRDQEELKYPLDDKQAAIQYHALKQHSGEVSGENGGKYSFKIMLDAYVKTDTLYREQKWKECNECFVKEVGGAQRSVPYWYQYLMSEKGECDWTKRSITEASGKKGQKSRSGSNNIRDFGSSECGNSWAIVRATSYDILCYQVASGSSTESLIYLSGTGPMDWWCCRKCERTTEQAESKLEKSLPLTTLQLSIEQNPKGVENNSNVIQFN